MRSEDVRSEEGRSEEGRSEERSEGVGSGCFRAGSWQTCKASRRVE